jgi:hypothetical protein
MKSQTKPDRLEKAGSQVARESNLIHWLSLPGMAEYMGATFELRAAVLCALITGENLSSLARRHGVTRAAASKQARLAKSIFGNL